MHTSFHLRQDVCMSSLVVRLAHARENPGALSEDLLIDLGCDLSDAGRTSDAEWCFRTAVNRGSNIGLFNLGNELTFQGRRREAAQALREAGNRGVNDAWLNLGNVLLDMGETVQAIAAFERASDAGDSNGLLSLAFVQRDLGQEGQAEDTLRSAVTAGNSTASAVMACWQWDRTLDPSLEFALRDGAEEYPPARADLADLLRHTSRIAEAQSVLERGVALGEKESFLPLGDLYADALGDPRAAEEAYRGGILAGDINCHHNLAVLLMSDGRTEEAVEEFRLGAAAGDELAARFLRQLLADGN
jgi:tetratricopeptide (TPR) repeat protein